MWRAHPNIRLRLTVLFVNRFLNYLLTPLMAVMLAAAFGAATAGALLLTIVLAAICATFVGGHLADTLGRRGTLLISEAGVIAAYGLMAAANSPWWHSTTATYCCFLVNSCMGALGFPANDAVMVDVVSREIRAALYTTTYWLRNVAAAAGLTVGGFSFGSHFEVLPLLGLVLSTGNYSLTVFALAETLPPAARTAAATGAPSSGSAPRRLWGSMARYGPVVRDRAFMRLAAAAVLIGAVELQLGYYLGIHLQADIPRQSLVSVGSVRVVVDGVRMLALMRTLNTLLVGVFAPIVSPLIRRLRHSVRLHAGIALFCGAFAAIAVSTVAWQLIALSCVYTVGELMNAPARQVMLADLVDARRRARYMALYGMRFRVGGMIASLTVVLGSLLPGIGMSVLYCLLGLGASLLLRGPLRAWREAAAAPAAPAPTHVPAPPPASAVPGRGTPR